MIKIFSKLKYILIITVIFISLLFALLVYRQFTQLKSREKDINSIVIENLERDFLLLQHSNQRLADTYFEESIKNNLPFLEALNEINSYSNGELNTANTRLIDLLSTSYENAYQQDFSFFKIYSKNGTLLTTLSKDTTSVQSNYTYPYTVNYYNTKIGEIELGLSVNSLIKTLQNLTNQTSFALYKKSEINTMSFTAYSHNYITSTISDLYFVDQDMLTELEGYTTSYDKDILSSFIQSISGSINDNLLNHTNFIVNKSINNSYYSLIFILIDPTISNERGYIVFFRENDSLTAQHHNFWISLSLLLGLYLTLIFIISFINYILHYLYHFSYKDHLTRIYNRHKFFEVIERNIYDFHRYNYNFTIILIDIDNFKHINDTYGHNTGDTVLIQLVKVLETALRTTDYLFRWGGEEFLVLLPHCDEKIGFQVSEKLRHSVIAHNFNVANETISASFGVASYQAANNIELLLSHADKALYNSKANGKNCSTLYSANLN